MSVFSKFGCSANDNFPCYCRRVGGSLPHTVASSRLEQRFCGSERISVPPTHLAHLKLLLFFFSCATEDIRESLHMSHLVRYTYWSVSIGSEGWLIIKGSSRGDGVEECVNMPRHALIREGVVWEERVSITDQLSWRLAEVALHQAPEAVWRERPRITHWLASGVRRGGQLPLLR